MAQLDSNPTAPPEEDLEFEWVEEGMQNENTNPNDKNDEYPALKPSNLPPSDFIIPNDLPIPDAIQQQLIYQRIMAQQQEKKEPDAPQKVSALEQKSEKQPAKLPVPQPKASFLSSNIQYPESELFTNAGLCVWRTKENGKGIQIMMGLQKNNSSLSFFGGARDKSDGHCADTAIREFHEETCKQLDDETLAQIRKMLLFDENRMCFWKAEWKSVLFYYEMPYDYNIVQQYPQKKAWNAEMQRLFWIDFDKIYRSVFISGNPIKISKNKYPLRSFVVGTILHEENRKYLMDLHVKHGGNIHNMQPKKGGAIRSTLKSFNHIPKAIRLDILHPITHNVIYHRWIEMDITQIEDYQLLISLISSICPEIGRNFMLYYTENGGFRSSKTQHVIDTIPSFRALQKRISKSNKCYVTQIALLPTFIISDNFRGISLSFKPKDVSWKHIHPKDDDEKNPVSAFIQNKANEFAQWWFGDEDNDNENNMKWKWQFANDKNNFEDFCASNSKMIEKSFVSGNSFAGFKRKSVPYQANFVTMCQKNLNTNKIRSIRRVPSSVKGAQNDINTFPVVQFYKWQYQNDKGQWIDYERDVSQQLNTLKQNASSIFMFLSPAPFDMRYTLSTKIKSSDSAGTKYQYLIDVWHFKQKNVSTKKERAIKQVPVYHNHSNHPQWYNDSGYKWQYKDNGWKDYDDSINQYIEQQYISNPHCAPFVITTTKTKQTYKIYFNSMQQQSSSSGKFRTIRRKLLVGNDLKSVGKHRWEWQDDDNRYKPYDNYTSQQIENAANGGIKKYFFVSNKNKNSYEINFAAMRQHNCQTGKQRKVRKILLEPEWKGSGPNPKEYTGPKGVERRTFGKKLCNLYCVVGDNVARETQKSGKLIRGTLGPFGAGLYFYDSSAIAQQMAKDRSVCNRGNVIEAKVFIGETLDVSNCDDKEYDFISLQKNGHDSVSRSLGFANEFIVYNVDQVCIVKVDKYRQMKTE